MIVSGLLKLVLVVWFADMTPNFDEAEFVRFGRAIYEGESGPKPWRAPGYQCFVAAGLWLCNGKEIGVRLLQVVCSLIASVLVYRIGRQQWSERVGLIAGAFFAFYPSHIAFSHLLWSETLFGMFVLLALERLLVADAHGSKIAAAVGGLALGAAALTRSTGLALLAAALVWLVMRRPFGQAARRAGLALAAALIVVAPWSIYATLHSGRVMVIDTNAGFNLWSGNNSQIPSDLQGLWSLGMAPKNGLDRKFAQYTAGEEWRGALAYQVRSKGMSSTVERDCMLRDWAIDEIRNKPGDFLKRVPKKLAAFWAPDFFLPRQLVRDWYGQTPALLAVVLIALTWLAAAVPLIGGPMALALLPRQRFRSLVLLWVAVYLATHALAYGHSRLHQPLIPVLILAVAALLWGHAPRPTFKRALFQGVPWAMLVLAAWLMVIPPLGGVYIMPGPRHAGVARALGAFRHAPLPGAKRLAWMLADVEASNGRNAKADRILEEGPWADDPWTLFMRARISESAKDKVRLLTQAVERDPELFAAWIYLARARNASGDSAGAENCLKRAAKIRPWDRRVMAEANKIKRTSGE